MTLSKESQFIAIWSDDSGEMENFFNTYFKDYEVYNYGLTGPSENGHCLCWVVIGNLESLINRLTDDINGGKVD